MEEDDEEDEEEVKKISRIGRISVRFGFPDTNFNFLRRRTWNLSLR